jgi:hypothetical protein
LASKEVRSLGREAARYLNTSFLDDDFWGARAFSPKDVSAEKGIANCHDANLADSRRQVSSTCSAAGEQVAGSKQVV